MDANWFKLLGCWGISGNPPCAGEAIVSGSIHPHQFVKCYPMANRRPIQQAHERANVGQFLNWFNRAYRSNFRVISEPNPPEAVVRSSRTTRWVEVSTAFLSDAHAKDLYSYATPGEDHKPVGAGPFLGTDEEFAKSFVSVVKKKLEKKSYIPCRTEYGPGYLVIPIPNPFFNGQTVAAMKEAWKNCDINDLGCFRSIYIAFSSGNEIRFSRWPIKCKDRQ